MKKLTIATAILVAVAAMPSFAEPYIKDPTAVPKTGKLVKSPVGSKVTIDTTGKFGTKYANVFQVQPDKSLKLIYQYELANQQNN